MKTAFQQLTLLKMTSLIAILLLCGCAPKLTSTALNDDHQIEIAILQINDVYEIGGLNGGTIGNLARIATYYQKLQARYPQSLLLHAGDFLNPSLINTLKYEGERIRGRQMIETLNAIGIDLVAFGNHEFDLDLPDLQKRINESTFDWIATNIQLVCGDQHFPFFKEVNGKKQFIPETWNRTFTDKDGTSVNIGVFSATIDSNPKDFVHYYSADSCARLAIQHLEKNADIIIGLTHLDIATDKLLAQKEPNVDLILGGHEHNNMRFDINGTRITKADANAKTAYEHILKYNSITKKLAIESKLISIDTSIKKDKNVEAIISKWDKILSNNLKQFIPDPLAIVYNTPSPLDGRENVVRSQQSNLGELIAKSMIAASQKGAQIGIINSGGIRIDDQLEGPITGVDIFRVLPFGGSVFDVRMKGSLLKQLIKENTSRIGSGGYLQYAGVSLQNGQVFVGGKKLIQKWSTT